jgi:hypothetical protein
MDLFLHFRVCLPGILLNNSQTTTFICSLLGTTFFFLLLFFFFFFSFGVPQLMLPEAPQPYGLLYYPRIGRYNFLHQFRAATPLKQRKLEL